MKTLPPEDFARAQAALDALGFTLEAVAESLRALGIHDKAGIVNRSWHCPIAQFLQQSGFPTASVGCYALWLERDSIDVDTKMELDPFLRDVVYAFDSNTLVLFPEDLEPTV